MTVYQSFFEMELYLSKTFNMTPFEVRREKIGEVLLLVRRLNDHNENEYVSNGGKKGDIVTQRNGETVIFRPATGQSGF